jgi:hypothetical protein
MLPPEQGSPMRPILAQMGPFVGFPFYSYPSDHPSHWPPRVYEDREIFGNSVRQFIRNPEYSERIRAAAISKSTAPSTTCLSIIFAPSTAPELKT